MKAEKQISQSRKGAKERKEAKPRNTLAADRLGEGVAVGPRLHLVGFKDPYIWIGNDERFVGIARNTAETRGFLKRALARMEKAAGKR